jgi:hypothetical protein
MTFSGLRTIQSWAIVARLPLRAARLPITLCETPPSETAPAVIARLTHNRPPWKASLASLAQRGFLEVGNESEGRPSIRLHAPGQSISGNPQLTAYEQVLLEAVFQGSARTPLAAVAPRLAWQALKLEAALENELMASGWLDADRRQAREQRLALSAKSGLIGAAMLATGLALAAGVSAQPWIALAILLVAGGIAGVGLSAITLGLGLAFSELSAEGERAAAQWKGYRLYLKREWHSPASAPASVESRLPLAIALGLTKDIGRAHPPAGQSPLPRWFNAVASIREQEDWGAALASVTLGEGDEPHEDLSPTPGK